MKSTQEQPPTFDAAMKAFKRLYKPRTTEEIGIDLGIPVDYNWDKKLKEEGDVDSEISKSE